MIHEPAIRVRVLFFSVLRDRVGASSLEVSLPSPLSGEQLLAHLSERYPAVAAFGPAIRLARNEEYAPRDCTLADGDEVALITPVSGG